MSTTSLNTHPYSCTFIYPHSATLETASASVKIKAPERGDTRTKGRNQNFARTKSGQVIVYDMGVNLSDVLKLSFQEIVQSEYAALIVFFDYISWGANVIKYIDYKGDAYNVRIYKNTLDAVNRGEIKFDVMDSSLYDFTLDLIDVTNTPVDTGGGPVPSQLAIHLADFNHPHNPKTTTVVALADGTKTIEDISVDSFKHVTWIISLSSGVTHSQSILIHATHNGSITVDATTVDFQGPEVIAEVGTAPTDITFNVVLFGAGTAQVMRLTCAKAAGSVDLALRRVKI